MLEIDTVTWRNFMSYGDYDTTINLSTLGQCLITGEISDDKQDEFSQRKPIAVKKSNGAGKSTIPNAIQWCLFGRTMHSAKPGDKIVNYFTGKNCIVTVKFKNGDSITRTRNTAGYNELFYSKAGDEVRFESSSSSTLSTQSNQQAKLAKDFNLDWEIFCGSVFFNQYGKPWMEMADASRKKAIERILHIDRFVYYSKIAKSKCDILSKKIEKSVYKKELLQNELTKLKSQLQRVTESSENFSDYKEQRKRELLEEAKIEKDKWKKIQDPEIEKLKAKWDLVDKIEEKISLLQSKINKFESKISEHNGNIRSLESRLDRWTKKAGKICSECEQNISSEYTTGKSTPIVELLEKEKSLLSEISSQKKKLQNTIAKTKELLSSKKPDVSMFEANEILNKKKRHANNVKKLKAQIEKIDIEINPHTQTISQLTKDINQAEIDLAELESQIETEDFAIKHFNYIYKAYNDRTKIKSSVYQEHIPYINERLGHYLDVFGLDVKIELTNTLGIKSNMWGYDFESGGERKRTDVAFMLAMFDFHEQMYGRQCNTLVLDEVDGRLDDDGIDALIDIIKDDLSPKTETILIISHRDMMFDTFENELRVLRKDRFSQLVNA